MQDLDGLRDLLALSHQLEDESEALTRAATAIRRHTHAARRRHLRVAARPARGCSRPRARASETLARRAIDIGQPIRPERVAQLESRAPCRSSTSDASLAPWRFAGTSKGPRSIERALAFGAAAAAVCAPLVYVLDRAAERAGSHGDAPFDLVGVSPAIDEVRKAIARAANAPFTVLIEGESGSGKELVARAIHRAGCRRERRFCAFNCAAMPEDLVDAELFGHAKGAFTGAASERLGLFESADGGTVFLDEVGELSARAQAKVLRVLQEGEVRRVGENFTQAVRRAAGRGDQSLAARRSRRGPVPAGPAVSPRRDSHQRAAAARARRGHSAAGRALLAAVGGAHRQQSGARPERAFARSRGMIGPATFASFRTC